MSDERSRVAGYSNLSLTFSMSNAPLALMMSLKRLSWKRRTAGSLRKRMRLLAFCLPCWCPASYLLTPSSISSSVYFLMDWWRSCMPSTLRGTWRKVSVRREVKHTSTQSVSVSISPSKSALMLSASSASVCTTPWPSPDPSILARLSRMVPLPAVLGLALSSSASKSRSSSSCVSFCTLACSDVQPKALISGHVLTGLLDRCSCPKTSCSARVMDRRLYPTPKPPPAGPPTATPTPSVTSLVAVVIEVSDSWSGQRTTISSPAVAPLRPSGIGLVADVCDIDAAPVLASMSSSVRESTSLRVGVG
mmetsp:Transcript_14110/g.33591  ORF Transcript_14110/g.33591 Transcript_14110/m.33591 type:complete len:306 (+) Transcript_14110:83-1000(+)